EQHLGLARALDLLAENVDGRELPLAVQPPDDGYGVVEAVAGDVGRGEATHDRLRHRGQDPRDCSVEPAAQLFSRMKPCRAALTSATASGKSTRMASRRAIACSSGAPVTVTCDSAAEVSSTAVLSVSVANCSRCASCTDSACCAANSCRPRRRS